MPFKNLLLFVKIGALKAVLYSGRQSNFDPNFYIFSSDLDALRNRNANRNLLTNCTFCENQPSESRSRLIMCLEIYIYTFRDADTVHFLAFHIFKNHQNAQIKIQ